MNSGASAPFSLEKHVTEPNGPESDLKLMANEK